MGSVTYKRYALFAVDKATSKVVAAGYADKPMVRDLSQGARVQTMLQMGQGDSPEAAQLDLEKRLCQRGAFLWFEDHCQEGARKASLDGFR